MSDPLPDPAGQPLRDQVPTGTADEVHAWAAAHDDPHTAAIAAATVEQAAPQPRRGLLTRLERLAADTAADEDTAGDGAAEASPPGPSTVWTVQGAAGYVPATVQLPDGTTLRDVAVMPTDAGLIVYDLTGPGPAEVWRSPIDEGMDEPTMSVRSHGHQYPTDAGTVYVAQSEHGCVSCGSGHTVRSGWVPDGATAAPWPS
ncbi:MAG: hypothetical protein ACRCZP_20115 [Phycicoccus sp.]